MERSDYVLRSRPVRVVFAGWESDTQRLQAAGWNLAVHQDYERARITLALQFKPAGIRMLADPVELDLSHRPYDYYPADRIGPFVVRSAGSDVVSQVINVGFHDFQPIDAKPQMVEVDRKSMSQFDIFAAPLVRTEEIIVEPQSVAECLDLIKRLQAPELAEVRKRNARRDEVMNQPRFHAQILSLAA